MNEEEIIDYWIRSSNDNYKTMQNLFDSEDYPWALFMGHLVIEKLLKANFVKNNQAEPPLIHDLLRIAKKSNLDIDGNLMDMLDEITTFNIKTRYDDYKEIFKRKCTKDFTLEKLNNIREVREWLIKKL